MNTKSTPPFPESRRDGTFPYLFYEANVTLIPKPKKMQKRKVQTDSSYQYIDKNCQQNISKQNSTTYEIIHMRIKYIHHNQMEFMGCKGGSVFKNKSV